MTYYYDINGYQLSPTDTALLETEAHFVLASDYDALAARLAEAEALFRWSASLLPDDAETYVRRVEAFLQSK
jgi:hypothetical protein